jgi:hypothetical protein
MEINIRHPLIQDVFINRPTFLPNKKEYAKHILFGDTKFDDFNFDKSVETSRFKQFYTTYSFPILSHEFIFSLKEVFEKLDIKSVSELSAGAGFFSFWAKRYGINIIDVTDNFSWKFSFKGNVLDSVKNEDSVKYVLEHPDIQCFILNWPYKDDVAETVWAAMKEGQYLLYIGEDKNGGNASDMFFKYIKDKEVPESKLLKDTYLAFWGMSDEPYLLKK